MGGDQSRDVATRMLRAIPAEDESPVAVARLATTVGMTETEAAALIHLLSVFGALSTTIDPHTGQMTVKARATAAALFFKSLAEYLEQGAAILHNWVRDGTVDPPYDEQAILSGPQFLYFMERRRTAGMTGAPALRSARISQVLIKRVSRLRGAEYLVVHDSAARQFQLPGGHARSDDRNASEVAKRELREELPGFVLDPATCRLVDLGTAELTLVSRTYGVSTRYEITFFHLQSQRASLRTGPDARWVSESDLLDENARVECATLNVAGLLQLNRNLAGGIGGLANSLPDARRGVLADLARRKPLEFWSLALGVLGVVLTVVIFFLQS